MQLTIPKPLVRGDAIGFISPSSGPDQRAMHRVNNAQKMLENLGYKVKIAKNALKNEGYSSASVADRIDDLHSMFKDKEVKMIMCLIGGNNSNHLLREIDYELIHNNPKIFIGYSDITVLHYALQAQAKLATYYGPCAMTQFGEYPKILDYTLQYFESQLVADKQKKSYSIEPSKTWTEEFLNWFEKKDLERARKKKSNSGYEWLVEGRSEGHLLGGAILSINHLAGTPFWLEPDGAIFFIDILKEGNILNEGAVDALLTDFYNMGLFEKINGLIISRPANYSVEEIQRLKTMIRNYTKGHNYPVLFNADFGHTDPIFTLRYGQKVRLDSSKNKFKILDL